MAQEIDHSRIFAYDLIPGLEGRQYVFHLCGPAKLSLVHEYGNNLSSEAFSHRTKVVYRLSVAWDLGFDVPVAEALVVDCFVVVDDADREAVDAGYG
jgi:hypothetical protein